MAITLKPAALKTPIWYPAPQYASVRGLRNNNPTNLSDDGEAWVGRVPKADMTDPRFLQFYRPEDGIAAGTRNFISYQERHNLQTIRGMINRHAPPVENNTLAYITNVAQATGIKPDLSFSMRDATIATKFITAVIHEECGQCPYSPEVMSAGIQAALNTPR